MKKKLFLGVAMCVGMTMFAGVQQPQTKDFSEFMTLDPNFKFEMNLNVRWAEPGIKGCVGDFNNDGIDDFILNGLWAAEGDCWVDNDAVVSKNFLQVYLGQKTGSPVLAYEDKNFSIAGNGAMDCVKLEDGSWMVAIQGGIDGNWSTQFVARVFNLSVEGTEVTFNQIDGQDYIELDNGGGRGSILFMDLTDDGAADICQIGWSSTNGYPNIANTYLNVGDNSWFEFEPSADMRPAANTFAVKADFNKDGRIDLLYPVRNVGLFAYLNNGDGSFEEVLVTSFIKEEREDGWAFHQEEDGPQAAAIDFNNDGYDDVVLAVPVSSTSPWIFPLLLYKNNGDGTFTEVENKVGEEKMYMEGGQRGDFAIGDFNLDGNQDIIFSVETGRDKGDGSLGWASRSYICLGDGTGHFDQFEITRTADAPNGLHPMTRIGNFGRMLTGDFDGNNSLDIVTAGNSYGNGLADVKKDVDLRLHLNVKAGEPQNGIELNTQNEIVVFCDGKSLFVNNASNAAYTLYSLTGAMVCSGVIGSTQETVALNVAEGVYMLQIGDFVQKVVIK